MMTREEAINHGKEQLDVFGGEHEEFIKVAVEALEQEPCEDKGEISDGYHTFNQLYHQRAILFATIVNQNKDKAWKSYKHSDGKYCFDSNGEWFIVGIDTPKGSYTYHYSKEYWNMFDCKELQCGKEWDGHTEEDVTRLLSLKQYSCEDAVSRQDALDCLTATGLKKFDFILDARDKIKILPSVTPQQRTGRWKFKDGKEQGYDIAGTKTWYLQIVCDKCGFIKTAIEGHIGQYKFCPNCGAKMESEVEE